MMPADDTQSPLRDFTPKHDFFIGIDSDGCAFDTMEIKHKECFIPNIIKHWRLQAVSKYTREAAEFVNLYSKWRGINRFPSLLMVFDLLADRRKVRKRGFVVQDLSSLRKWVEEESKLGNPALQKAVDKSGDPVLKQALEWSKAINESVEDMVHGVPPFPYLRQSLEKAVEKADMIVVSATPCDAITREWTEHDIAKYVSVIAGQEMGKKAEHLALATKGKYEPGHALMIGDAPGDRDAAFKNNVLFYPINPGSEEESWQRFYEEALGRFFKNEYDGDYQSKLIKEFESFLPELPPWRKEL